MSHPAPRLEDADRELGASSCAGRAWGWGRSRFRDCWRKMGSWASRPALPCQTAGQARSQPPLPSLGSANPLLPKAPPLAARAKRVVHLFMNGGPSHVDTFDPKPVLTRTTASRCPRNLPTERKTGAAMASPFRFQTIRRERNRGQRPVCPHRGDDRRHLRDSLDARRRSQPRAVAHAHELRRSAAGAAVRRLVGALRPGYRKSESARLHRDVPGRVPDRRVAELAVGLLAGNLPGDIHRQPARRDREADRAHSQPLAGAARPASAARSAWRSSTVGTSTAAGGEAELEARIQSFELAYRMQSDAADAFDITQEPESVRAMYGPGVHARQLLATRRLLERGVRFVQLWHGDGQPWDHHDDLASGPSRAGEAVRPADRRVPQGLETARNARRHAGDLGRRVRPHSDGRAAHAGLQPGQDERPRPQPLRFHDVDGRRRSERRLRSRRDRRPGIPGRPRQGARARPARDHSVLAGLRS